MHARSSLRLPAALCALIALLAAPSAPAATLVYLPFEEQVDRAEVVAVGRVAGKESRWDDNRTVILTRVRFTVEEAVKGEPGAELAISVLGGTVGEISQSVQGVPEFVDGRRYVLFLERLPQGGEFRVLGLSQGSYPVATDRQGSSRVGPSLAAAGDTQFIGGKPTEQSGGQTLPEFLARIRGRLQQSGQQPER